MFFYWIGGNNKVSDRCCCGVVGYNWVEFEILNILAIGIKVGGVDFR